nr:putative transposon protein [Tanacetum cinerariifolium]
MNNNDDGGYEEYDVDEDDLEEDSKRELDAMIETLYPNQDEEVALGIQSVRNHYRILQQIREPTTNEPEKEVKHGDKEANNSWNENENYLDYFDLESLHEDVLEDGTIELRRTPVRFLRMYVCLVAVRKRFLNGCKKYLGFDGCFLKGMVKAMLLTDVGKDPNNLMYP